MKKRLFLDMDGLLAEYRKFYRVEQYFQDGYYLSLKPNENIVRAVKKIILNEPDIDVYVLSAFPQGSNGDKEKDLWLDKHLPELKHEKRIFTYVGQSKRDFIEGDISENDYLFDDYTVNLVDFEKGGGHGIKGLNGLNNRNKSWDGCKISYKKSPEEIYKSLVDIIIYGKRVVDEIDEVQLRNETSGFTIYISKDELSSIVEKYFSDDYEDINDFMKNFTNEDWTVVKKVGENYRLEETTSIMQFNFELNTLVETNTDTFQLLKNNFINEYLKEFNNAIFELRQLQFSNKNYFDLMHDKSAIKERMEKISFLWNEHEKEVIERVIERNETFIKKFEQKSLHKNPDFKIAFTKEKIKLDDQLKLMQNVLISEKGDVNKRYEHVMSLIDKKLEMVGKNASKPLTNNLADNILDGDDSRVIETPSESDFVLSER